MKTAESNAKDFAAKVEKSPKQKEGEDTIVLSWSKGKTTLSAEFRDNGIWQMTFADGRTAEGKYPSGSGHFSMRINELMA